MSLSPLKTIDIINKFVLGINKTLNMHFPGQKEQP